MSVLILVSLLIAQDANLPLRMDDAAAQTEDPSVELAPVTDAPSLIALIEGRLAAYGDTVAQVAARKARERYLSERLLPVISRDDLDEGAQGEILAALADDIRETEAGNARWAAGQIDPEDFVILWTENRRLGEDLLRMAEHNPDSERRLVAALEPIALSGAYDGAVYAERADALALSENRPQPYGTAVHCVDGQTELWPLENAETLADTRAALGLDPLDVDAVGGEACDSPDATDP